MNPQESYQAEKQSAYLYRVASESETHSQLKTLFSKLAEEAESQAQFWEKEFQEKNGKSPQFSPNFRIKLIAALTRRLGPRMMRKILTAMKLRGMSVYNSGPQNHIQPQKIEDVGHRHHSSSSANLLRASVFGINDGLVSNASLIFGIAGATADPHWILISGVAGWLAGAFSMAAGEFVSVRSQQEMLEYQINLEKEELREYPEAEAQELALIYEAKGIAREEALRLAQTLVQNPERALDTLVREELGLNPDDLGSPYGAAISSFLSFSLGAILPLLPFLFWHSSHTIYLSMAITGAFLFFVGSALSLFSGKSFWWGGFRMLLLGSSAAAATFWIGKILGVQLS